MVTAICKSWDDELGWGVLVSSDVPGEMFAHFSHIEGDGYRTLSAGEQVQVEWESYPRGQDGYFFRARRVVRSGYAQRDDAAAGTGPRQEGWTQPCTDE